MEVALSSHVSEVVESGSGPVCLDAIAPPTLNDARAAAAAVSSFLGPILVVGCPYNLFLSGADVGSVLLSDILACNLCCIGNSVDILRSKVRKQC